MSKAVQAIRGMNDLLPEELAYWQTIESSLKAIIHSYGYREIRFPIVESTALFKRSIGEVTDIVEKEMYTFDDRNGDSLTLRPEGTAGCVRTAIEHSLLYQQVQRLWYQGPMFRHERPQKGRYRQFYQIGVEAFGIESADIDAELILMTARFWKALGLEDVVSLELNTLGTPESRKAYRQDLVAYFESRQSELDEDSQRRLHSNPLRILDSKNPEMQACIEAAPKMRDYLDNESAEHFKQLCAYLDDAGLSYQINPRLVRGLDYYNRTVFEWVTDKLGAQGTVCAGGRYDGLVEQLGGKACPAAGFAMGIERLVLLYKTLAEKPDDSPLAYLIKVGDLAAKQGMLLTEQCHQGAPAICMVQHAGGGSFKSQFKKADKSGARLALILGDDEVAAGTIGIKYLREDEAQITIAQSELIEFLTQYLENVE